MAQNWPHSYSIAERDVGRGGGEGREVQCQERGFCVSSGRPELSTGTTRSSMLGRVSFSCGDKGDSGS